MIIGFQMNAFRYISLLLWFLFPSTGNAETERSLAIGDFADFNKILDGAVLRIPNAVLKSDGVTLRLSNIRCSNLAIGDLNMWSRQTSFQTLEVDLQVENLDMFCRADYSFSWLFLSGDGSVDVRSLGNDARIQGLVKSPNFMTIPPEEIIVKACNPSVNINDINFSGGFLGWILNVVERLLRNFLASNAETQICNELGEALKDTEGFLRYAKEVLDELKPRENGIVWDPLGFETNLWMLELPDELKLLNFRDPDTEFGGWLEDRVNQAVDFLRAPAKDPVTGRTDMQANIFLRSNLLESGALVIDTSDFLDNSYVYEGHNNIMKTSVRFDSLRLAGLDTLNQFNPLDNIGMYTHQNQLAWDYLAFEIKATIWMSPSTLSDSIIEAPGNTVITEEVEIFFGIDDLIAELSIMSLFDQDQLEKLTLGSLLIKDNVSPCLLSTIAHADFSSLSVDVTDILTPSLSGFVSPGFDRIISSSMDAGFLMYEKILLNAAPRYFQERIRPLFADMFLQNHLGDSTCPVFEWSGDASDLIDFRDLLYPPLDAVMLGGTDQEPYGDLFSSFVMPYLRDNIFEAGLFNDGYVRPFTKAQSGTEGRLAFEKDLYQYNGTDSLLYDSMVFTVSEMRLDNIDTFVGPMDLLFPSDSNIISNSISLDGGDRDLTATVRLSLGVDENSPMSMENVLDLSLSLPSSALSFDVMANLKEGALLNFPVFDMANTHCWLATLDNSMIKSLALMSLSLDVDSLRFRSNCVSCSSPGLEVISSILQQLEAIGFNALYNEKISSILVGLISDYTNSFNIDDLVDESAKHCPNSPSYNPNAEVAPFSWPGLPGLRSETAETILAISVIAMQSAVIVTAKNELMLALIGDTQDKAEEILAVDIPEGSRIVNWTSVDDDMGSWAGIAFDELRFYLTSTAKEPQKSLDLEVNNMLREYVLDEEGALILDFDSLTAEAMDYKISLARVKVYGLDTMKAIEPLLVTGPQSLENSLHFETLLFSLEVDVRSAIEEVHSMKISYRLQDVRAEVDMNIALDLNKLENIRLGSIFDIGRLSYCAGSGIHDLKFTKLDLQAGTFEDPIIAGYFSEENQQNIRFIVENLFETHREDIVEAMPLFFDSSLRKTLNSMLPEMLRSMSSECSLPTRYSGSTTVDFRDLLLSASQSFSLGGSGKSPYGDLFSTLYALLQEKILQTGATNRPLINDFLRGLSERYSNTTGSMYFQGDTIENSGRIKIAGFDASFGLAVSDVALENVDSVGDPLDIFRPMQGESSTVNNTISFGVDSKPLGIAASLYLSIIDGVGVNIQNKMRIAMSFENVVMMASLLLQIAEENFASFPLRDLSNIHCWLAAARPLPAQSDSGSRGIDLVDQTFSIGNFTLDVNCTSCSSPRFDEFLLSLYGLSNDTEAIDSIQDKTDNLLDTDLIQVALDFLVEDSVTKCPHRPEYDLDGAEDEFLLSPEESGLFDSDESAQKPIFFNVANSVVAGTIFICGVLYKWVVHRRNKRWMESLSREGRFHLQLQEEKEKRMEKMLDETTTSLLKSECITKRVRYGVPFALALNLGLYLGAHLGVLSVVDVDATLAGEPVTIKDFLKFTFIESTKNTFDNGGAEMVILLWAFTGVWPYIKIFLSLVMWVVPPTYLRVSTRRRILMWNDTLAKLSIIDIFTLIVGVALLLVFIGGPDESFVSEDALYSLKAIVVPRAGFYCIIIAQRISRVSSRFLLEYHEQAIQHAIEAHKSRLEEDSSGALHAPTPPHDSDDEVGPLHLQNQQEDQEMSSLPSSEEEEAKEQDSLQNETRWGTVGAMIAAFTILIVFIIGAAFAPSISLDATSVGALAIESDKTFEQVVGSYGVFLVISGVLFKARFVFDDTIDYIGFGLLLLAAVVSAGMVFIIQAYRFIKRKLRERKEPPFQGPSYGHKGCGIPFYICLTKWRHMEIYMISVAIGIWQLGSVTSYAIYLYCEILHKLFDFMSFVGLVESTSSECYNVQALLPENLAIILGSFAILMVSFVLQAKAQYRKNIDESLRWIDDEDVPRLSLAWSQDMSKNSKYSHLTSSLTGSSSFDTADTEGSSTPLRPPSPHTPATHQMMSQDESDDETPEGPYRITSLDQSALEWQQPSRIIQENNSTPERLGGIARRLQFFQRSPNS